MNKFLTLFAGILAILSMSTGCCSYTGCTSIDLTSSAESGLVVTNFHDNPIHAYIYYDYSKIKDFDESKVSVDLTYYLFVDETHTLIPTENISYAKYIDVDEFDYYVVAADAKNQLEFAAFSSETPLPKDPKPEPTWHWVTRPATITERKPGYLRILALDDLGSYTLKYNK